MFCMYCGKKIPDDAIFCCYCGANLRGGAPASAPAPAPSAPATPTTKEGWMLLAIENQIRQGLKDPDSAKFGNFENIETDGYGRVYAEIVVRATNSYGAMVPTRYAAGFLDVTDHAPCYLIPKTLFSLPGIMVNAQRSVIKKNMAFGKPRV